MDLTATLSRSSGRLTKKVLPVWLRELESNNSPSIRKIYSMVLGSGTRCLEQVSPTKRLGSSRLRVRQARFGATIISQRVLFNTRINDIIKSSSDRIRFELASNLSPTQGLDLALYFRSGDHDRTCREYVSPRNGGQTNYRYRPRSCVARPATSDPAAPRENWDIDIGVT